MWFLVDSELIVEGFDCDWLCSSFCGRIVAVAGNWRDLVYALGIASAAVDCVASVDFVFGAVCDVSGYCGIGAWCSTAVLYWLGTKVY